jgi:hypothetical protein
MIALGAGHVAGQELPTPLSRPTTEEAPPQAVVHEMFVKGVEANQALFDRTFCEGEFEIHWSDLAEPITGRFRCWQYFREGEGPRPARRCLRLETEGDVLGVWVVGPEGIDLLYDGEMKCTPYGQREAVRPMGVNMPSPPLCVMAPPGGFGTVTFYRSLSNPTIQRSLSRDSDVITLVQEEHTQRGTKGTRWGTRQTCRFRVDGDQWMPIACEDLRLRGEEVVEASLAGRMYSEMTYRDGRPAELEAGIDPDVGKTIYRFDRWEKMDAWNEDLFTRVTRDGWKDPRKDGLIRYELSKIDMDDGTQAPVWQLSEWKDGEFRPTKQQWVAMTQIWEPATQGIDAGVKKVLDALMPDKPERLVFCDFGPTSSDNKDLQDFLQTLSQALEQREIPYEQATRGAFQTLRRLHRLTCSVRDCYDGTLLQWNLFGPGELRGTALGAVWVPHPGRVPEGGEITTHKPPGTSVLNPPPSVEDFFTKPEKIEVERLRPGTPVNPQP